MPPPLDKVGKYQIIRKLATGGMAEVFLARASAGMGVTKTVVVKRILPHFADEPHFVEMFLSEARLVAELNHPNIVQMFDFGEADGSYFIAMEYIDGPNLKKLSQGAIALGHRLSHSQCAWLVAEACKGMAYVHDFTDEEGKRRGLIHRDISSDNILLSRTGAVKVVDFGIAKAIADKNQLTKSGVVKGKLAYMPSEQLRGEQLDHRVDVFALGIVLYELLAGKLPYEAESEPMMIEAILKGNYVPLDARAPGVPAALQNIVRIATSPKRDGRYADCREMHAGLEEYLHSAKDSAVAFQLVELVKRVLERETTAKSAAVPPTPAPRLPADDASVDLGETFPSRRSSAERREAGGRTRWYLAVAVTIAVLGGAAAIVWSAVKESPIPLVPLPAPPAPVAAPILPPPPAQEPAPAKASVSIQSDPPGAEITIDGAPRGVAPVSLIDLPAGPLAVELRWKATGVTKRETLELAAGDNGTKILSAGRGRVEFWIRPFATIYVDGKHVGDTPIQPVELAAGRHQIRLVGPDGKEARLDVTVGAGRTEVVKHSFR